MSTNLRCDAIHSLLMEQLSALFEVSSGDSSCFVSTPLLTPDNSEIEIEVTPLATGGFRVGDAGSAEAFLFLNGVTDVVIRERSEVAARRFGFEFAGGEIAATVTADLLARAIFEVAIAVQDVSVYRDFRSPKRKHTRTEYFKHRVERAVVENGRIYERDFEFRGVITQLPRKIDLRVLPMTTPIASFQQLALFMITGDASRSVQTKSDLVAQAARDLGSDFRIAAIVDSDAPSADTLYTARQILKEVDVEVISFEDSDRFRTLLAA